MPVNTSYILVFILCLFMYRNYCDLCCFIVCIIYSKIKHLPVRAVPCWKLLISQRTGLFFSLFGTELLQHLFSPSSLDTGFYAENLKVSLLLGSAVGAKGSVPSDRFKRQTKKYTVSKQNKKTLEIKRASLSSCLRKQIQKKCDASLKPPSIKYGLTLH